MCNNKGWDACFLAGAAGIRPHFCGIEGDCGSIDRPMESAAEECAAWHERQAAAWRSGEHEDIKYYKSVGRFLPQQVKNLILSQRDDGADHAQVP